MGVPRVGPGACSPCWPLPLPTLLRVLLCGTAHVHVRALERRLCGGWPVGTPAVVHNASPLGEGQCQHPPLLPTSQRTERFFT